MESLRKKEYWDMVTLYDGINPIGIKCIFKRKTNLVGQVEKFKAQLVAKGYSPVEGVDFGEIFSPILKLTSIRLLLHLFVVFDLEIGQMDMRTKLFHGDLEEEICMKEPEGFTMKGKKELVCRLKQPFYGLKQYLRMWYQKFDSYIQDLGFKRS